MRTMEQWIEAYGVSHQNPFNKGIHWICVPLIFFSLVGLLAAIPHGVLTELVPASIAPFAHFGSLFILAGMTFFLRLSIPMSIGMLLVSVVIVGGQYALSSFQPESALMINVVIFVVAWVGQFVGHKIEGAKPSFFEDLQFLLVGPAWLLHFVYRKVGISY